VPGFFGHIGRHSEFRGKKRVSPRLVNSDLDQIASEKPKPGFREEAGLRRVSEIICKRR
jgi:hypothetical protein